MSVEFKDVSGIICDSPFTANQTRAVTRDGNVIVSAGAGSGKTTVMIARIIDKLLRGARIGEMLIVTFTRASAADMRVKLAEKLVKLKTCETAPRAARIAAAEAIDELSAADVGTLHSYCQKLIKTYFYAAQTEPSATVCEESEAAALKRAAASAAVTAAWESGDEYFAAMYDALRGRRGDDGVVNAVCDVADFALSMPDPTAYLTEIKDDETRFKELDVIIDGMKNAIAARAARLKAELEKAGMQKHASATGEFVDYIDGKIDGITATSFRAQGDMRDLLNEEYKRLKAECKDARIAREQAERAKKIDSAPYARALCAVAADALRRYEKRKEQSGKIDYSDLEHGAYRVLENAECMREIADKVKYVFIDEFQDVNPLQAQIAQKFKDAGAEMFVVGDVKQSIYGFRRCSPKHFKAAVADGGYTHIALADNFRSSRAVIDFVNGVFDATMTDSFGGADYADERAGQRLVYGNKSITGGSAEYVLINDGETDAEADGDRAADKVYSVVNGAAASAETDGEAEFIADCATDWVKSGGKLGSIAVLMRSFNARFCAALARAFDARGIRYAFGRKSKAKDFAEVTELTDIARFVDNRYDDVAIVTAMRSPMGGFSDEEIAAIAADGEAELKKTSDRKSGERKTFAFWQKVEAYRGELSQKIAELYELRADFARYAKRRRDSADVIGYITSGIDYFAHIYERGGDASAVQALIDCAAERHCGLHEFLNYYDGANFELPTVGQADAVNVTTIHASKGLEYDYVILADTARKFNERDCSARVITSEDGVAVKAPDRETRTLERSAPWLIMNYGAPAQTKAEELRLLYVALTRAKRKLTVCGKTDGKPREKIDPRDAARMSDFMSHVPAKSPPPSMPTGERAEQTGVEPIAEIARAVRQRIEKAQAYENCELPIKTCVTAIASQANAADSSDDYESPAPILTDDDRLPAREKTDADGDTGDRARMRGTAYHRAMELIDFDSPDINAVKAQCDGFELVEASEILRAAAAMKNLARGAAFVAKERYFIFDVPAEQAYGARYTGESVLVQGVIDLLIAYGDGTAIIVDYKTGDPEHLKNVGYATQLRLYASAVEKSSPYKVKGKYLYSFASGELIEM